MATPTPASPTRPDPRNVLARAKRGALRHVSHARGRFAFSGGRGSGRRQAQHAGGLAGRDVVDDPQFAREGVQVRHDRAETRAVAAEGGLRYGEATALRAKDVTIERDQDTREVVAVRVNVARAVGRTEQGIKAGATKSEAGVRKVVIFGDRARIIADHVRTLIGDALLFPAEGGSYLPQSSFHRHWNTARKAADRSDMPFHALRHFSATEYAKAGATPAENNARHGWSTPTVGLRYTHAGTRDDELAARMARRRTESA